MKNFTKFPDEASPCGPEGRSNGVTDRSGEASDQGEGADRAGAGRALTPPAARCRRGSPAPVVPDRHHAQRAPRRPPWLPVEYAFRFTAAAQRQLRAVSRPDALRVLTALGEDPYRQDADVTKLTGPSGLHRLRVEKPPGRYQINDGELVVLVVKAGDRRDVHRNR